MASTTRTPTRIERLETEAKQLRADTDELVVVLREIRDQVKLVVNQFEAKLGVPPPRPDLTLVESETEDA
jgi:hypothetical protein